MNLYQLVYVSKFPQPLVPKAFKQLLEHAKLNNMHKDITGIMLKYNEHILQVLEGNRHTIQELFDTIENDNRHINVRKCLFEPLDERRFGKWSMAFLNLDNSKHEQKELLKNLMTQLISKKGEEAEVTTKLLLKEFDQNLSK